MIIICVTAANPLQMRCDIYMETESKNPPVDGKQITG